MSDIFETGSITVLKIRSAGYKYRRFFGLKLLSWLALRQGRRRRRVRACLWELWGLLCYSSTLFVFLITPLKFFKEKLKSNSSFSYLSLSLYLFLPLFPFLALSLSLPLWVYWISRGIRQRLGGATAFKFVTLSHWEYSHEHFLIDCS